MVGTCPRAFGVKEYLGRRGPWYGRAVPGPFQRPTHCPSILLPRWGFLFSEPSESALFVMSRKYNRTAGTYPQRTLLPSRHSPQRYHSSGGYLPPGTAVVVISPRTRTALVRGLFLCT